MKRNIKYLLFALMAVWIYQACKPSKTITVTKVPEGEFRDPLEGKSNADLSPSEAYIKTYKDIAVSEMIRAKIPASITLAQGILESGNGNSYLATKANNHFGIKCGSDWTGKKVYFDDDEANECFRSYDNAELSYIDHSNFLRNGPRYAFLFDLDPYDYKGWANGLKEAGYATRRNYAELLISIIEKYQLFEYDKLLEAGKSEKEAQFLYNNIPATMVRAGDNFDRIARANNITIENLLKYNDMTITSKLKQGQILYLKPKKKQAKETYHIVKKGDRMHSIAQEYGIWLDNLYAYNLMSHGQEPTVGEVIYLRAKRKEIPKLKSEDEILFEDQEMIVKDTADISKIKAANDLIINKVNPSDAVVHGLDKEKSDLVKVDTSGSYYYPDKLDYVINEKPVTGDTLVKPKTSRDDGTIVLNTEREYKPKTDNLTVIGTQSENKTSKVIEDNTIMVHSVKPGETIYGISKQYNITVENIKSWNNLTSNEIPIGTKLYVRKPPADNEIVMATNRAPESVNTDGMKAEAPKKVDEDASITVIHTTKQGETLYGISRLYNVTVESIKTLNNLVSNDISVGAKLTIKTKKPVDNEVMMATPKVTKAIPDAGHENTFSDFDTVYHIAMPDESIYTIAKKYGITSVKLISLNGLKEYKITPGQRLIVRLPLGVKPPEEVIINKPLPPGSTTVVDAKGRTIVVTNPVSPTTTTPTQVSNPKITSATGTVAVTKPIETAADVTHVVQPGETLFSLSKRYGVSIESIKSLNGLTSDNIAAGRRLVISQGVKTDIKPSASVSPVVSTSPQPKASTGATTHTVEQGQTLYSISRLYGVTVESIKTLNNLSSDNIKTGQKLIIK